LNQEEINGRSVTIKVDCDPNIEYKSLFSPFKFMTIIDNLINNSIKANAKYINVKMEVVDENTLELRVKDDGTGIPDKNLSKIFHFGFSTTDGSGIGLYIVKKILAEYGSITVNNRLEKGVEFVIKVIR
jgi:signal transduction histidine kinase